MRVDLKLIKKLQSVIRAELAYEKATQGRRRLGITGEAGELLACHQLGLRLVLNPIAKGHDALDKRGRRVQIKTCRTKEGVLAGKAGRTSRFSEHKFDYALMVFLDERYRLGEIWRAGYKKLLPFLKKEKRRNPPLAVFRQIGRKVFDARS